MQIFKISLSESWVLKKWQRSVIIQEISDSKLETRRYGPRAPNNGRPTDNVRPDRGLDRSNSRLAGHFDRSFLDACRLMRFAL